MYGKIENISFLIFSNSQRGSPRILIYPVEKYKSEFLKVYILTLSCYCSFFYAYLCIIEYYWNSTKDKVNIVLIFKIISNLRISILQLLVLPTKCSIKIKPKLCLLLPELGDSRFNFFSPTDVRNNNIIIDANLKQQCC